MKRLTFIAAFMSLLLLTFSCEPKNPDRPDTPDNPGKTENPDNPGNQENNNNNDPETPPEPEKPSVKTCADNLVLHISFDVDGYLEKGEGLTFKENKGDAAIVTGFIGKGWAHKSGVNTTQAYTKYDVAANSVFTKIESVTFTSWIKINESSIKGGLVSLNGGRAGSKPHDFPAFIVYYDNNGTNEETGEPWQQVNGRFIFHDDNGNEINLWLDTGDPLFAKYGEWCQFGVTYDNATGLCYLFLNGMPVRELTFGYNFPFYNLVTEYADAFYVGGWSTFIEGHSTQNFQNYWSGGIDEIRMFDKALSEDEMLSLYKEELAINLEQE